MEKVTKVLHAKMYAHQMSRWMTSTYSPRNKPVPAHHCYLTHYQNNNDTPEFWILSKCLGGKGHINQNNNANSKYLRSMSETFQL